MKTKVIQLAIVPVFALTGCGDDVPKEQKVKPASTPSTHIARQQDGSYKQCANGRMVAQNQTCYKKCASGRVVREEQDCTKPYSYYGSSGSSSSYSSSGRTDNVQRNGFGSTSYAYGVTKSVGG